MRKTLSAFVRDYWFWLLLPSLVVALVWLLLAVTAGGGDAPGSYAIM